MQTLGPLPNYRAIPVLATSLIRSPKGADEGSSQDNLIRDHDGKFGVGFARVAKTNHIEILTITYHAPRANAICERFLGSVRRECLDHLLILHEKQLHRVLNTYIQYFNQARPHQGIRQRIPEQKAGSVPADHVGGTASFNGG